jgi:transcriptional antiterminator RfaH
VEHLERQGFHCYQPFLNVEKLRQRRRVKVAEPLFPRYVFIELDNINDNWAPIRSTRGVSYIVRFDENPLPVPGEIIEEIRNRLVAKPFEVPYLKPGERVRITAGSFANLEAIFIANDGEERAMLLLNILHSEQRLSFPVQMIKKCANP